MARKRRSDFKPTKLLNPEQRALLRTWLIDENLSYEDARQRLIDDFNVKLSTGSISTFYATECFSLSSSQARSFAEQVGSELEKGGEAFDRATIALVKKKAFERAVAKNGNLTELQILAGIIGDSAKLKLKQEQLEFSREKFREEIKTSVEKGLDALLAEIKGNEEALALFDRLKATVMRSVEGEA